MGNITDAIGEIEKFLASDKTCMVLSGSAVYEKHKLLMAILDQTYENGLFLFRTNSLQNITNEDFLGWVGIKDTPKSNEQYKIRRNYYEFDNMFRSDTMSRTSREFDGAIVYPVERLLDRG